MKWGRWGREVDNAGQKTLKAIAGELAKLAARQKDAQNARRDDATETQAMSAGSSATASVVRPATLADDGPLPASKAEQIARTEAVVRAALKLVGVEYDALIRLPEQDEMAEGVSPYALAVRANPRLPAEVLAAEEPVLAALEAALAHKGQAEFAGKYGQTPDEVREAIRHEMALEHGLVESAKPTAKRKVGEGLVFSQRYGVGANPARKSKDLAGMFGR